MFITGLLDVHSAIRYAILILLITSLFTAYRGLISNLTYTERVRKLHFSTRMLLNLQMFIGLLLYLLKGYYHIWANFSNMSGMVGFFAIGHILFMFIGIILINIGYQKAMQAATDRGRYKHIAIFYSLGFLMIFMMIPWPFFHKWAMWF